MSDIISASHDVVFKALFVRNPDILRAFLRDILDLPLTESDTITILNPELIPDSSNGKLSRLDIHIETASRKFNVEMQSRKKGFSVERILYYWARMFIEKFGSGSKYENLEQTFSVNILNFNYLDCKSYHSSYSIREDKRYKKLTDKLSIHIFELPKLPKGVAEENNKIQWMKLIRADSEEELEMIKTTTENSAIKKGIEAVYALSADTALREKIRQRDKAVYDYYNDMAVARDEGELKGRREGRKEGEAAIIEKMRKSGMTDEQIKKILE